MTPSRQLDDARSEVRTAPADARSSRALAVRVMRQGGRSQSLLVVVCPLLIAEALGDLMTFDRRAPREGGGALANGQPEDASTTAVERDARITAVVRQVNAALSGSPVDVVHRELLAHLGVDAAELCSDELWDYTDSISRSRSDGL